MKIVQIKSASPWWGETVIALTRTRNLLRTRTRREAARQTFGWWRAFGASGRPPHKVEVKFVMRLGRISR